MFTMEVWFKAGGWSPNDIPCFSCLGNPAVYLLLGHRSISCSNWSPVISHLLAILTATSYFPCNGLKSPNIICFLWSLVAASFTVWMQLEGSELQVTIHVTTWLNPAKWALLLAHNLAAFLHLLVECLLRAFQLSENTHTHTNCVESPGCFPQSHCFWDYVAYHKCAQTSNCKWEFSVVYY